jgi:ligand-binding sensor domain-containing protein/signal transduction histidine kinase
MAFSVRRCAWWLTGICVLTSYLAAERLPVRLYTTADGLARNRVARIIADSKGFIWLCTTEGLSRFDGYRFVNYGTRDGLASRFINDLLEARDGTYWIATAEGLCRLHPKSPKRLFTLFDRPPADYLHAVNALTQDHNGTIWAATDAGLYRVGAVSPTGEGHLEWVDVGLARDKTESELRAVIEDREGNLWAGGATGLIRHFSDGHFETYTMSNGLPDIRIETMALDGDGRIWAGTRDGLCLLVAHPRAGANVVERVFNLPDGLAYKDVKALTRAPDGAIWMGGLQGGISEIHMDKAGRAAIRTFGKGQGLPDESVMALTYDREGNLWVGGESGGAMRIVRNGLTTFTTADGLATDRVAEVFADRSGAACAASNNIVARGNIARFNGRRFETSTPTAPRQFNFGWSWSQIALQSRNDKWWMATPWGLMRFPSVGPTKLPDMAPERILTLPLHPNEIYVFRVFEDSRGGIWSSVTGKPNSIIRWDPDTERITSYVYPNFPTDQLISEFAEDGAGNMWMGMYGGGLIRYRHGQFVHFTEKDGVPTGLVLSMHLDAAHRLWIGTGDGGLGRIDQPDAEHPAIRIYDAAHGLTSDSVDCITSDQWGRIYCGTGRGMDRIDPLTDRVKHYTTADGLANDAPMSAARDGNGSLWFATTKGVSRLIPEVDRQRPPPPILITALTIAGAPYPISQLGETELSGLEFRNGQVQIEFAGLSMEAGEVLNYQYRIEGANGGWSTPDRQRNVNLAGLRPGNFRFLVRAVDSAGQVSAPPAAIAFRIPPPLWGELWFQAILLAALSGLLYAAYRARLAQVLELERVRMRIATDLHDDIGSSLSQIAILSEVARSADEEAARNVNGDGAQPDPLTRIATISRELIDSMADIVWAINPKRDSALDLTRRMRQFAGEMLVARDIDFTFDSQGAAPDVHLGADFRRQVFLIFKESIANAARHSGATHVGIVFEMRGGRLFLEVSDDGKGIVETEEPSGHGLESMRRRAAAMGGQLNIVESPEGGARLQLSVPYPKYRWRSSAR